MAMATAPYFLPSSVTLTSRPGPTPMPTLPRSTSLTRNVPSESSSTSSCLPAVTDTTKAPVTSTLPCWDPTTHGWSGRRSSGVRGASGASHSPPPARLRIWQMR